MLSALLVNEEAHHWGKLANVIEYIYTTRAPWFQTTVRVC